MFEKDMYENSSQKNWVSRGVIFDAYAPFFRCLKMPGVDR